MKYLENDKLTQLTSELTDAVTNSRMINGRLECFTTKRIQNEKKYAHQLGEKYVEELEREEEVMASIIRRKRSASVSEIEGGISKIPFAQRSASVGQIEGGVSKRPLSDLDSITAQGAAKRSRAKSFDSTEPYSQKSALGDFFELGTRRLMTDLILTLNACFPDYDFSNVRPSHFVKMSPIVVVKAVNSKLSELAAQKPLLLKNLWDALDETMSLNETEVYSYAPNDDLSFLTQTLLENDGSQQNALWSFNYFFVNKSLKRILFFSCVETMLNEISDEEDDDVQQSFYYKSSEVDFDLDPTNVAGGIPFVA